MATGFDRLERLFSIKRKPSFASVSVATSINTPTEPQFPSPSFIRPTATRMAAREEVRLRIATSRSPSVPDVTPSRLGSLSSHASSPGFSRSPTRSPSLLGPHPREDSLVAKLREYQFPNSPSPEEKATPMSTALEIREIPSPRSQSPLRLRATPRLDTPPSPDLEDIESCRRSFESIRVPTTSYDTPPTPEYSPEILPVRNARNLLADSKIFDIAIDKALFEEIEDQLLQTFDYPSLNDSFSDSSLSEASSNSSTLREPDFNEFLNLSDDDIAEVAPDNLDVESDSGTQLHSPLPMDTSPPSPKPSPLLTLTPPSVSRPATAAAFEAARIARRYDFDLVYVVNLWPGGPRGQVFDLESASSCKRPLVGRLLAAHGLDQVPSPLQISPEAHATMLRSKGWVEYKNAEAQLHEIARGYACSFYSGKYSQSCSHDRDSPVSGVRLSEMIDRGIVFAAYRKPRIGPCRLGHSFTGEDLSSLYGDAETLVEMLIDIHTRNRQYQPDSNSQLCDETGPLPMQELGQPSP